MAATLGSVRDRVEELLVDPLNLIWKETTLEEAVRLALAEYNRTLGVEITLNGLDGAAETTLPGEHESVLVVGTAAYAAAARSANRTESFQPDTRTNSDLAAWARERLEEFRLALEQIRSGDLKSAQAGPWAEAGWKLDAWDGG